MFNGFCLIFLAHVNLFFVCESMLLCVLNVCVCVSTFHLSLQCMLSGAFSISSTVCDACE
jgi:hypothetical protein